MRAKQDVPTPPPWPEPEYDNDTGPFDEGFWEWWAIEGIARFDHEADARFARRAVNMHQALVTALSGMLPENCGMGDDPSGLHRPSFEKCEMARKLIVEAAARP
jgi:hypothetical protein